MLGQLKAEGNATANISYACGILVPIAIVGNKLLGLNFPTNPCKRKSLNLRNQIWTMMSPRSLSFCWKTLYIGWDQGNSHKSLWLHLSFEIFWQCLTYIYIYISTHTAIHNIYIYIHMCSPFFQSSMLCWVALHTSIIDAGIRWSWSPSPLWGGVKSFQVMSPFL